MARLLATTILASLTLVALGSTAQAAPPAGSTSSGTYSPATTSSTTTYKPSTSTTTYKSSSTTYTPPSSTSTYKSATTSTTTYKPNYTPSTTTYKPSSSTVKPTTTTNYHSDVKKYVSKPPIPVSVKLPGKHATGYVSVKLYAGDHGVKFKRGVYYRGLHHRHWSARHYHPRWRTWMWYCPSTHCWYYWCRNKTCFLPTTVISDYPPVIGDVEDATPPDADEVPRINGSEAPDVPNPEGIE